MAKNDVDKLHKQKGKNKPITRMKAERNVWVYSQLQTQGGWKEREREETNNNEGMILEN